MTSLIGMSTVNCQPLILRFSLFARHAA